MWELGLRVAEKYSFYVRKAIISQAEVQLKQTLT